MNISLLAHRPMAWPPHPLLLALLGLRPDACTKEEYEAAWTKAFKEHLGDLTPKQLFIDGVHARMRRSGEDYNAAWKWLKQREPKLYAQAFPDLAASYAKQVAAEKTVSSAKRAVRKK